MDHKQFKGYNINPLDLIAIGVMDPAQLRDWPGYESTTDEQIEQIIDRLNRKEQINQVCKQTKVGREKYSYST